MVRGLGAMFLTGPAMVKGVTGADVNERAASVLSRKFTDEFKGGAMARAKARRACQNEAVVSLGSTGNLF